MLILLRKSPSRRGKRSQKPKLEFNLVTATLPISHLSRVRGSRDRGANNKRVIDVRA
jgi:hypothetical protein